MNLGKTRSTYEILSYIYVERDRSRTVIHSSSVMTRFVTILADTAYHSLKIGCVYEVKSADSYGSLMIEADGDLWSVPPSDYESFAGYPAGAIFEMPDGTSGPEYYLLAETGVFSCSLVNLAHGTRWTDPVITKTYRHVTPSEWLELTASAGVSGFKRVPWLEGVMHNLTKGKYHEQKS